VSAERSICRSVELVASLEQVWSALTDAQALGRWLCDRAYFRPEIGAPFRFEWGGGLHADGQICACEPGSLLAYSYRVPAFQECVAHPTEVRFELASAEISCLLTLEHRQFLDDESWDGYFEGHRQCWDVDLAKLDRLVRQEPVGDVLRLEFNLASTTEGLVDSLGLIERDAGKRYCGTRDRDGAATRISLIVGEGNRVVITEAYPGDVFGEEALYDNWREQLIGFHRDAIVVGSPYA